MSRAESPDLLGVLPASPTTAGAVCLPAPSLPPPRPPGATPRRTSKSTTPVPPPPPCDARAGAAGAPSSWRRKPELDNKSLCCFSCIFRPVMYHGRRVSHSFINLVVFPAIYCKCTNDLDRTTILLYTDTRSPCGSPARRSAHRVPRTQIPGDTHPHGGVRAQMPARRQHQTRSPRRSRARCHVRIRTHTSRNGCTYVDVIVV